MRRGKGDILEWNNAYNELIERRIAHLINVVETVNDLKTTR